MSNERGLYKMVNGSLDFSQTNPDIKDLVCDGMVNEQASDWLAFESRKAAEIHYGIAVSTNEPDFIHMQ